MRWQEAATTKPPPNTREYNQWRSWKEKHSWLFAKEDGLGCLVCQEDKTLLLYENEFGVHLADVWIDGAVSSPVQKQQCSYTMTALTITEQSQEKNKGSASKESVRPPLQYVEGVSLLVQGS